MKSHPEQKRVESLSKFQAKCRSLHAFFWAIKAKKLPKKFIGTDVCSLHEKR